MPHQARYKCILVICQLPFNHKVCPSRKQSSIVLGAHAPTHLSPKDNNCRSTSTLALQRFTIPKHYPQIGTSPKRTSTKEFQQVVLDATRSQVWGYMCHHLKLNLQSNKDTILDRPMTHYWLANG
jgi:hypothetical protein